MSTFEDVKTAEIGTVFIDRWDEGLRFVVMRGPVSLCAYVGVPSSHPLAGHSYDNLPVSCHGGLTYASESLHKVESEGLYWYGWDYAHAGDVSTFDAANYSGTRWTPEEVDKDSWHPLYDFKALMKLTETVARRVALKGDTE